MERLGERAVGLSESCASRRIMI